MVPVPFVRVNRKLKSEIRRLAAEQSDGEEFTLTNPAPKPDPCAGTNPKTPGRRSSFRGWTARRGSRTYLPPMARLGKPVVVPSAPSPVFPVDGAAVGPVAQVVVNQQIDAVFMVCTEPSQKDIWKPLA